MLTADGPQLIEYNARFGDPECQVLMMRLESDLVELIAAACSGRLGEIEPKSRDEAALTVVMAAQGYTGTPTKGTVIEGPDAAAGSGAMAFHASTARDAVGRTIPHKSAGHTSHLQSLTRLPYSGSCRSQRT